MTTSTNTGKHYIRATCVDLGGVKLHDAYETADLIFITYKYPISRDAILRYSRLGKLPHTKISNKCYYHLETTAKALGVFHDDLAGV